MNLKPPNGGNGDLMKWVANLLKVLWYVGAIGTATWFLFEYRQNQVDAAVQIAALRSEMVDLKAQIVDVRETRWKLLREADKRMRRLYLQNGWEYVEIEP